MFPWNWNFRTGVNPKEVLLVQRTWRSKEKDTFGVQNFQEEKCAQFGPRFGQKQRRGKNGRKGKGDQKTRVSDSVAIETRNVAKVETGREIYSGPKRERKVA